MSQKMAKEPNLTEGYEIWFNNLFTKVLKRPLEAREK